ncbi:D-alanyl-D-alanine carboxypeptidase/D-alanyl-D-alanine endopeptidase [Actinomyces dentalis]|uniref:D-alanyl-D-alanine carboxypeptidase/D-alanyl-D-alanine endopeptidase n=1 Tax=Actinomyces dentalis TaxID=272548 RepID=UPI0003F87B96|nr:D-alanyl-D-alanine carboxypeptidase/D-alanyl-D-alanine-endopeptidase [Actinomyces dentalis]
MRKATIAVLTAATLVVGGAYYGLADALDLAPGPLSAAEPSYAVQPFPTPSPVEAPGPQITGLAADAPTPSATVLSGYAGTLAGDSLIPGATTGVSVIDVATGTELVDHQASVPLTPASSNKVLTAWASLSALGGGHRMETRAVLSGGTVTLVGGGDVLLAADAGDPSAVVGHAGLGDLARAAAAELTGQGVTSVGVALDDTLFTGPAWNSGWESGNEAWVGQIQPIMVDVTAYGSTGYPADPAMEAARAFSQALSAAGITVTGEVTRAAAPAGATKLASVQSAPLADVLSVSIKASDNTMTEVEGRVLAAATGREASFTGATQAVREQLQADGFDVTGLTLVDVCGLAKGDKVPAHLLTQIIARAAGADGGTVGRDLLTALPVGALDGTLSDRYVGTSAAGVVRAKTGSLDQTVSLTGTVVTADGRLLAYSVIIDGFPEGGMWSARTAMDNDLIVPLSGCGCRG